MENKTNNITVSNKDLKIFNQFNPDATLTHYFKTKDNKLRVAFFNNKKFIAIETPKGFELFRKAVLEQDTNNMYQLLNHHQLINPDGSLKNSIYIGNINLTNPL